MRTDLLLRLPPKNVFPTETDFFGAAQALIRLQDTYELNITQLSSK